MERKWFTRPENVAELFLELIEHAQTQPDGLPVNEGIDADDVDCDELYAREIWWDDKLITVGYTNDPDARPRFMYRTIVEVEDDHRPLAAAFTPHLLHLWSPRQWQVCLSMAYSLLNLSFKLAHATSAGVLWAASKAIPPTKQHRAVLHIERRNGKLGKRNKTCIRTVPIPAHVRWVGGGCTRGELGPGIMGSCGKALQQTAQRVQGACRRVAAFLRRKRHIMV